MIIAEIEIYPQNKNVLFITLNLAKYSKKENRRKKTKSTEKK
tara:strand:+ start:39 stop:164 length:126 start_codon:yes stop_codon:yes gene_type:complete